MLKSRSAMLAASLMAAAGAAAAVSQASPVRKTRNRARMTPEPFVTGMTQEQHDWNAKVKRRNKRAKR
jgi:hypothetical protein